MSNVIQFPRKQQDSFDNFYAEVFVDEEKVEFVQVGDELVKKPRNSREYLALCKAKLTEEDYKKILCAVMDLEYYLQLESRLKGIVDAYCTFLEI